MLILLQNRICLLTLSSEGHPPIQRSCAFLAAAAGPDSYNRRGSLDHVSQADFLLDKKARKTDVMQSVLILFLRIALRLHNIHPNDCPAAND